MKINELENSREYNDSMNWLCEGLWTLASIAKSGILVEVNVGICTIVFCML